MAELLARRGQPGLLDCARGWTLTARGRRLRVTLGLHGGEVRVLLEAPPPAAGAVPLSARERAICRLLPLGLSNKEIALRLELSPKTVGKHLEHIFTKLGVTSRAAAVAAWAAPC